MANVQPVSSKPRVGNVYLLRGWIGIFSTGIDALTDKLNAAGVRASVYQDTQYGNLGDEIVKKYSAARFHEPLILIGHSYGADDVIRIAKKLDEHKIPVDLLVTLDAVTPPDVPGNVRVCYNLYQSNGIMDKFPFLRGIPLDKQEHSAVKLTNVNLRKDRPDLLDPGVDHFNIEKQPRIHEEIIRQVLAVCPPRIGGTSPQMAVTAPRNGAR
jgi:pimeloyl-ACP methyl ester carboxylesterase